MPGVGKREQVWSGEVSEYFKSIPVQLDQFHTVVSRISAHVNGDIKTYGCFGPCCSGRYFLRDDDHQSASFHKVVVRFP